MATRILTLFDEEDFSQEETPATRPAKPAAATTEITGNEPAATETAIPVSPINGEEPQEITDTTPEEKQGFFTAPETEANTPAGTLAEDDRAAATGEQEPEITEEAEGLQEAPAPEQPEDRTATVNNQEAPLPAIAAIDEVPDEERIDAAHGEEAIKTADEVLNRQMLSELIQMDYTALIHKEYPFDLHKTQVVTKEKEIAVPAVTETVIPEAEQEEEEVFEEIVPLPEWNLDKKYYTIGEVAQLFAVNTSHIRFWTNEFKLKPRTTRKGDRLYNPGDIAELRLIHHLVKEKKHTIKGAREKLKAEKTGVSDKLDLKESLTGLRDILLQIKEQL